MQDKTATTVVLQMKEIFVRYGIPEQLMSNKMPCGSREFHTFAKCWGIQLETSSPEFPQSNGESERYVQLIKKMLKKADEEGTDIYLPLPEYRSTQLTGTLYSPTQILMSRALRGKPPASQGTLRPATLNPIVSLMKQSRSYGRRSTVVEEQDH